MSSLRPLCQAQRYSIKAEAASAVKPQGLDASKLTIERTGKPKGLSKPETLVFGREFTGKSPPPNQMCPQLLIFC